MIRSRSSLDTSATTISRGTAIGAVTGRRACRLDLRGEPKKFHHEPPLPAAATTKAAAAAIIVIAPAIVIVGIGARNERSDSVRRHKTGKEKGGCEKKQQRAHGVLPGDVIHLTRQRIDYSRLHGITEFLWRYRLARAREASELMQSDVSRQMIAMLPRLRRFARALARSPDDADDLVQGACERALRAIDSWEPGTRLDSWMFRILRNLWIDQMRKRRMETNAGLGPGPEIEGEDGRRTVESRLELADIRTVITELPEQQREVLALVCIEDMSYRETASILDIPIGTVMSRLARARQALVTARDQNERHPEVWGRGSP
jgi:RNA polymerase sigma-70 factor (ECF subfamily)